MDLSLTMQHYCPFRWPGVYIRGPPQRNTFIEKEVTIERGAFIDIRDGLNIFGDTIIRSSARISGSAVIISSTVDGTVTGGRIYKSQVLTGALVEGGAVRHSTVHDGGRVCRGRINWSVVWPGGYIPNNGYFYATDFRPTQNGVSTLIRPRWLGEADDFDEHGRLLAGIENNITSQNANKGGSVLITGAIENPDPPEYLIDIITHELINDAVMTPSGHTFDRSAIQGWLETNPTNPVTREALTVDQLIPNRALQSVIEAWKYWHPITKDGQNTEEAQKQKGTPSDQMEVDHENSDEEMITSEDSTREEDSSAENSSAEDANAEDANAEDANAEDANAEDASAEDASAEDFSVEDSGAEDSNEEELDEDMGNDESDDDSTITNGQERSE